MSASDYIVLTFMFATFGVLMAGIVLMGAGGNANKKFGNKLMMARVSFQGMVIAMLTVMFFVGVK